MTQLDVTVATSASSSSYQQTVVSTSTLQQAWIKKEKKKVHHQIRSKNINSPSAQQGKLFTKKDPR